MKNITLKQLRYFEFLAQHGHFGRAAEAAGISQPALSMQIKELEDSAGMLLFERSPRKIRLSSFGEVFALRVKEILRQIDELDDLTRAAQTSFVGRLRIGVIPTIAPYLLPRLIEKLAQKYSGMEIHIRETLTQKLIEELLEGQIDTAIVALPISENALSEVALFDEKFMLVRPRTQADTPVPNVDALRQERLLLLEEGHCFRDQALSFCNITAALPRDGLDGSSLATLVQLVGAGIGITLIPEMAVSVETRSAPVAVHSFSGVQPKRTVGMIWRKSSPLTPQLQEIAQVVKEAANATTAV